MMRVAFASDEDRGLDSLISPRFGRANYFVIVDTQTGDHKVVRNPGADARSGAAIKAVQLLIKEGVKKVYAGSFGPNAMTALEEMGIEYVQISGVPVKEVLSEGGT